MSAELKASRRDGTLILTLSNPGARNALHPDMYAAAIETLSQAGVYERVNKLSDELRRGVQQVVDRHGMQVLVFGYGPMWHMLFTDREPTCYADVLAADGASLLRLERELIRQGLFVLPGNRRFVSIAHTEADIEDTLPAIDAACREFLKR